MLHAFKLYTGEDQNSHFEEGFICEGFASDVISLTFKISQPHASYNWHNAPVVQYVITLSGTLEFTTQCNEKFIIKPGDILLAADTSGTGHKWRLIDDAPWRRAYAVLRPGAPDAFRLNK